MLISMRRMPGSNRYRLEMRENVEQRPAVFHFESEEMLARFLRKELSFSKSDTSQLVTNTSALPSRPVAVEENLGITMDDAVGLQRKLRQEALTLEPA